jgi:hypothetical protein
MKSMYMVMVVNLIELVIVTIIWMILFQKRLVSWILKAYGWIGFGANWDLEIRSWLGRDFMYKLV